jgi:hypothetical protein
MNKNIVLQFDVQYVTSVVQMQQENLTFSISTYGSTDIPSTDLVSYIAALKDTPTHEPDKLRSYLLDLL